MTEGRTGAAPPAAAARPRGGAAAPRLDPPVRRAAANGVELAYQVLGDSGGRPLLLVAGLGQQLLAWPDGLVALLVDRGFRVVRFDNRDTGESTHLHDAPRPDVLAALRGDVSSAAYTLDDLADDAAGLLDALDLPAAHVVGMSMGGMVAQVLAVRHRSRVLSLASVFSTPAPKIGSGTREAVALLLAAPARSRQDAVRLALESTPVLGSPAYPADPDEVASLAAMAFDRGHDPRGVGRQLVAIHASGDRTEAVRTISAPTLVVHGADDPLITVEGGRATAAAVPGAELLVLPGMGHDLPRQLWPQLVDAIARTADRAEGGRHG